MKNLSEARKRLLKQASRYPAAEREPEEIAAKIVRPWLSLFMGWGGDERRRLRGPGVCYELHLQGTPWTLVEVRKDWKAPSALDAYLEARLTVEYLVTTNGHGWRWERREGRQDTVLGKPFLVHDLRQDGGAWPDWVKRLVGLKHDQDLQIEMWNEAGRMQVHGALKRWWMLKRENPSQALVRLACQEAGLDPREWIHEEATGFLAEHWS